jgi:hypothetical protein
MSCPRCHDDLLTELTADQPDGYVVEEADFPAPPATSEPTAANRHRVSAGLLLFVVGLVIGFLVRGATLPTASIPSLLVGESQTAVLPAEDNPVAPISLMGQVNPPDGYLIPAVFGDVGPQMLAAGAIDYTQFARLYDQAGQSLTAEQQVILTQGTPEQVHITGENAYFLLNFFWALGLVNENRLLTEGPLAVYSDGQIGRYAATGGWTIGQKPPIELIASAAILHLNHEQQERLEEVAANVYRPCCNNHTAFPDCNHGMALLGLLQLMAAQNAGTEEMFEAAKYVNAFWFPSQTMETAAFFHLAQGLEFADVDARLLLGPQISSATGFQNVQQWLAANGSQEPPPGGVSSCGV